MFWSGGTQRRPNLAAGTPEGLVSQSQSQWSAKQVVTHDVGGILHPAAVTVPTRPGEEDFLCVGRGAAGDELC